MGFFVSLLKIMNNSFYTIISLNVFVNQNLFLILYLIIKIKKENSDHAISRGKV